VPLVAVLTGHFPAERASVHRTYLNAIWLAGGQPVILSPPPAGALTRALDVIERCDALLLTGGGDIDPARYGETPAVDLMAVDPGRDTFELAALDHALAAGRPVLGVCRGLQVMTVGLGGRLHQDVGRAGFTGHWDEDNAHMPVHGIRATPGSLAELALNGRTKVNSIHHQAVADPGPRLAPTAWADDDLIEAVEAVDGRPLLGVQWHPERMVCPPEGIIPDLDHLAAFEWLVRAAGGAGDGPAGRPLVEAGGHDGGWTGAAAGHHAWGG
jgi:putative glutamine amidotransferase